MKNIKTNESEIISFNEQVPEVATLLDLDDSALDTVVGGLMDSGCDALSDCPKLTCIDKCGVKIKASL